MQVLILDDNVTNLMLIKQLVLRIPGCEPLVFESPVAALARMPELSFDIALVDYVMPGMDGIAFVHAVRNFPKYRDIPIVMVTHGDSRDIRLQAIVAGATDFVNKPIEPIEFKARLKNLLQLRETQLALQNRIEAVEASSARRPEAALLRAIVEAAHRRDLKALAEAITAAADVVPVEAAPSCAPLSEDAFDIFLARLAAIGALHSPLLRAAPSSLSA
jgi:CheY-like chemotaxis protein